MSCLGVFFSLSPNEVAEIRALAGDSERVTHIYEVLEEKYFDQYPERLAQADKAWDAMHHALIQRKPSLDANENYLSNVVLGGENFHNGPNFIMRLKTPKQVKEIALVLPFISRADFRLWYNAISPRLYAFPKSDDDQQYTWDWFEEVREFWLRAAEENRYVLFTAE